MKLEFTKESGVTEYMNGPLHLVNDGKAIEVDGAVASDLLNARHLVDGEFVNVFRAVGEKVKVKDAKAMEASYPDNFPHADVLAKAGYAHADAILLSKEQLVEISGIGPKSADAIIDFSKEK